MTDHDFRRNSANRARPAPSPRIRVGRLRAAAGVAIALAALLGALPAAAQTVTRGPYLQTPTPTSMIVRWRTDVATDSRVAIGGTIGSLTQNFDDPAATTEHVVQISGLSPDTRYFYSVGTTAGALQGDDADHFFRTTPTPGTARKTRIWVTGDGGFANANGFAVRDAYATYNAGNPTDLWLLLGDNAYVLGTDADYQAALFDMHEPMLRNVPVWSTFGNHESFSSNSLTQTGPYFAMFSFPKAGEAGGVASGTESYYSFDYANMHFIVLDAMSNSNLPGSPMMLWLEADLQATTADWVIAFWHHPPYSKGLFHDSDVESNEVNMRTRVLPMLEDYGVDLVLSGHSHNYERSFLLDGHYGLSPTFDASYVVQPGLGRLGDVSPYRKDDVGLLPHSGVVYVVAGSSSEVRNTTLNHPALPVGLLELGSLVLDVDDNRLTASFLNNLVQTSDTFTIEKGMRCAPSPRAGCNAGAKGRLVVKKGRTGSSRDVYTWTWRDGSLDAAQVGDPTTEADLAICAYDQAGRLVGGRLPRGAATWKATQSGSLVYDDKAAANGGIRRAKIKPGVGGKAFIRVTGKGTALGEPTLPAQPALLSQLVNLDTGACWQTDFPSPTRNDDKVLTAVVP